MEKVKAWRKKAGLKQSDVAGSLGISQGTYSRYERKELDMPTVLVRKLIGLANGKLKPVDFYPWISAACVFPEQKA